MSNKPIPTREKVHLADTWDLESIFATPEDWENTYKAAEARFPELTAYQGKLGEDMETLLEFLKTREEIDQMVGQVMVYGRLKNSVDTNNAQYNDISGRGMGLQSRFSSATAFAVPEMMSIGFDTLKQWMAKNDELANYKHYFERMEETATHVRSAEVEELLSAVSDPFRTASQVHGMLANADLPFKPAVDSEGKEHELAHSNIDKYMNNLDRTLRKSAWENYADAHLAFKNTMGTALAAGIKQDVFMSRARRYDSSLEAALGANFIPVEVFHNLIKTFKANLPTWHKYWDLRKRALKVDALHVYDTRAALTGNMPDLTFDQAVDWISEGMAPLGEEYVSIMRKGVLEQRWVDRYPNKGKRFGAFSWGYRGTHPFIMMSFNNDIFGLSTLAHELGHSMHSYFTRKTQPAPYVNYGLFAAEVASNFNQAMVRAHLLETQTDKDMQIAIIEEAMNNFHRYFFIMPTLARFELEVHERDERGEGLTADSMIELMADLFSEGYGLDMVVDRERVGSVWAQFSTHLYSNFYVFQYATGISGAHALAEKILSGSDEAREAYLKFLHSGGNAYPMDILKGAGVDLSSPEPVEKTFEVFASYVDRLEKLVG